MAERYLFFNSTANDPRVYQAQDFADYFGSVLLTGLLRTDEIPAMSVSVEQGTMNTVVSPGKAIMQGHLYENTTPLRLTHPLQELGADRIDRIVLRLDRRNQSRFIRLFVKQGTPSDNPAPPSLQRDNNIYEISLAQVLIRGGQSFISPADITDERGDEDICPWARSTVLPHIDSQDIVDLRNEFEAFKRFIVKPTNETNQQVRIQEAIDYISENGGGIVQLLKGTYTVDNTIYLKNNVILQGTGWETVIKWKDNANRGVSVVESFGDSASLTENIGLRNLKLDFNYVNQGSVIPENGVALQHVRNVIVENVWFDGGVGLCQLLLDAVTGEVSSVTIKRCYFAKNDSDIYSNAFVVSTSAFGGGFSKNISVLNNKFNGEYYNDILFTGTKNECSAIIGNIIEKTSPVGHAGISASGRDLLISGNLIKNCSIGIFLIGVLRGIVRGNSIEKCWSQGITLEGGVEGHLIANNTVVDCGYNTTYNPDGVGIWLRNCRWGQITGNNVYSLTEALPTWGIRVENYCEYNTIIGNALYHSGLTPLSIATLIGEDRTNIAISNRTVETEDEL